MSELRAQRPPLRIALRLAARNARRSLGRSILIVLMMAIPVAGMSATAVVVSSSNPTDQEFVDLHFADATAIAQVAGHPGWEIEQGVRTPVSQYFQAYPPEGDYAAGGGMVDPRDEIDGRVVVVSTTFATVQSGESLRQVEAFAGDVFAPELAGRYDIESGGTPRGDDEVAVSAGLAENLGLVVGDQVTVLPSETVATIVGIGRSAHAPRVTHP